MSRTVVGSLCLIAVVACQDAGPVLRWGDVNTDSHIDSVDAHLVIRHAVGLSVAPLDTLLGDVDADRRVTTRDALIIKTYADGQPVPVGSRIGRPFAGGADAP